MLCGIGKSARCGITLYSFRDEVKAKTTITDTRRGGSMVKGSDSQRVYRGIDIEGTQGSDNRTSIKILQLDMQQRRILRSTWRFSLVDDLKAHLLNHCQVIIKGATRFGRDGHSIASQRMVACRPMAGTTSHGYTRQQQWLPALGCPLDTFGNDDRWRRHDELKAVFYRFATLEEQYILRSSADVNGQDANR